MMDMPGLVIQNDVKRRHNSGGNWKRRCERNNHGAGLIRCPCIRMEKAIVDIRRALDDKLVLRRSRTESCRSTW
jgi:hypothetical protein